MATETMQRLAHGGSGSAVSARGRHERARELGFDDEPVIATREWTGWVILLLNGAMLVGAAFFHLFHGRFFGDAYANAITGGSWETIETLAPSFMRFNSAVVRCSAIAELALGLFVIGTATSTFRRGEPSTSYLLLLVPFYAALDVAIMLGYDALTILPVTFDLVLMGSSLVGLTLRRPASSAVQVHS